MKSKQEIILRENLYEGSNIRRDNAGKPVSLIISQKFSNLFNSYAQAYNKENGRKGSLFVNRYKRILISDKKYLLKLIHYIHYNPVMANLCYKPHEWKYSSYNTILSKSSTLVARKQVIDLFEAKENFLYCHREEPKLSGIE